MTIDVYRGRKARTDTSASIFKVNMVDVPPPSCTISSLRHMKRSVLAHTGEERRLRSVVVCPTYINLPICTFSENHLQTVERLTGLKVRFAVIC